MKKVIGVFIAFCVSALLGIAAIIIGACGENGVFGDVIDIAELTKENAKSGLMVKGTVYGIWDKFADEGKTVNGETKTVASYYTMVMPYSRNEESPIYIGIYSKDSKELESFEQMRKETEDVIINEADLEYLTYISFRGRLEKLDDQMLSFLKVSVSSIWGISEEAAEEYITPYVIVSSTWSIYIVLLIIGIALTVIGVVGVLILVLKDLGESD